MDVGYGVKELDEELKSTYVEILCNVIIKLREKGCQVVASCDFEHIIVEKTGWNWTETTPEHPPAP